DIGVTGVQTCALPISHHFLRHWLQASAASCRSFLLWPVLASSARRHSSLPGVRIFSALRLCCWRWAFTSLIGSRTRRACQAWPVLSHRPIGKGASACGSQLLSWSFSPPFLITPDR